MLGELLIPLVLFCTLCATAGLAVVPQARTTITPVAVTRPAQTHDGMGSVRAEGHRAGGQPISLLTSLAAGESVIITAHDFAPGAKVTVRLSGQSRASSSDFADLSGTVHFVYQLPARIAPGQYRVIVEEAESVGSGPAAHQHGGNVTTVVPQFALLAFAVK